jgi:hypothetical protein
MPSLEACQRHWALFLLMPLRALMSHSRLKAQLEWMIARATQKCAELRLEDGEPRSYWPTCMHACMYVETRKTALHLHAQLLGPSSNHMHVVRHHLNKCLRALSPEVDFSIHGGNWRQEQQVACTHAVRVHRSACTACKGSFTALPHQRL